jgi:hypothetical protein
MPAAAGSSSSSSWRARSTPDAAAQQQAALAALLQQHKVQQHVDLVQRRPGRQLLLRCCHSRTALGAADGEQGQQAPAVWMLVCQSTPAEEVAAGASWTRTSWWQVRHCERMCMQRKQERC